MSQMENLAVESRENVEIPTLNIDLLIPPSTTSSVHNVWFLRDIDKWQHELLKLKSHVATKHAGFTSKPIDSCGRDFKASASKRCWWYNTQQQKRVLRGSLLIVKVKIGEPLIMTVAIKTCSEIEFRAGKNISSCILRVCNVHLDSIKSALSDIFHVGYQIGRR